MKTIRHLALLLTFVLLCAVVPLSVAQDDSTLGLSPEDYAAWIGGNAASASATSAQFNFTLTGTVTGGDAPVDMNITGTGLYGVDGDSPIFQLTLGGSANMAGQSTPVDVEIRLIGNTIYFNGPAITQGQWWYVTSEEATGFAGMMGGSSGMPMNPSAILSQIGSDEGMAESMQALAGMNVGSYVSVVRNGNQFTITPDVAGYLASSELQQFLLAAAAMNPESTGMSDAEMQQAAAMMGTAFKDFTLTIDQFLAEDNTINRTTINLNWAVNPSEFGQEGSPMEITLIFDISLSGYNGTYNVAVPEGAVSLTEIMQQMMQPSAAS